MAVFFLVIIGIEEVQALDQLGQMGVGGDFQNQVDMGIHQAIVVKEKGVFGFQALKEGKVSLEVFLVVEDEGAVVAPAKDVKDSFFREKTGCTWQRKRPSDKSLSGLPLTEKHYSTKLEPSPIFY